MKPAPFDFIAASSVSEAVSLLTEVEGAKILAGGQSLMPLVAMHVARPTLLVDVNGLALDHIAPVPERDEFRTQDLTRPSAMDRWDSSGPASNPSA